MEAFEEKLCHRFGDRRLLETALTHSSYANESRAAGCECNERLEFLGDSILGMVVADALFRRFPDMPEGRMTRLRARLVCEESLHAVASELGLGSYIRLGRGEEHTGGRQRASILADAVEAGTEELLAANARDRSRMNPADPAYDRLLLDRGRLLGIAADLRNVAALPSPLGRILDRTVRPNGMEIRKISVPFGVVGVIYEARPNVGFDVFALCVKSGNACILKGGSDARDSNAAIAALIRRTLAAHGFDENTLALLPPTHEATAALLGATGLVDLVIPRGGRGLIDFVRDHARVPVIETGAGVCHAYFDRSGDTEKGAAIVLNAKTRRVSVCNALDTLVVHRDRLTDLPRLCRPLAEKGVELQADEAARTALHGNYPAALLRAANTASFGTEFLSLRLSIRTVVSLDEALAHIARYSSQHSETIIAEDAEAIRTFQREVDAACVYANVSTAFTDGAQFGMGAEIGISTQKLHARGPMALRELTSYKYLIAGDGQTRP